MSARILCFLLSCLVLACGSKKRPEPPVPVPFASTSQSPDGTASPNGDLTLEGKDLYENLCASCHGGLEQSSAARASTESIQTAILNIPEMQTLPLLKDDQVNSLASALSKIPPGKAKGKP
jgi:cytochrome c5